MRPFALSMPSWILTLCFTLSVVTQAAAEVVDFEDLSLPTESHWEGPDPAGVDVVVENPWGGTSTARVGGFQSGGATFVNRYTPDPDYPSWSGFGYSNQTDTTTASFENQFSAYAGSGYGGSRNFAVAAGYRDVLDPSNLGQLEELPYFTLPVGAVIESVWATNTTYAALSMLNGDEYGFTKKFGGATGTDGDWFKLTAYGTDAAGDLLPATVDFYLADYRFSDSAQDYVVDDWQLIDLSALAGARQIYFNLASSDVGEWGMNTPGYFALDQLTYSTVPEPSSLILLVIGGLSLGAYSLVRRRTPK